MHVRDVITRVQRNLASLNLPRMHENPAIRSKRELRNYLEQASIYTENIIRSHACVNRVNLECKICGRWSETLDILDMRTRSI